jgi:hypothetical protein
VSYLLVALGVYAFVLYRRWWLLLLPLPLLYYFVATTYFYALVSAFVFVQLSSRGLLNRISAVVVSPIIAFVVLGVGLTVVFYLAGLFDPGHYLRRSSFIFVESRQFQIPLGLLLLALCVAVILLLRPSARASRWLPAFLFISLVAVGGVNFQLFSGFMVSQKNYYDYGISVLLGVLLILVIELLVKDKERHLVLNGIVLIIAVATVATQLPRYKQAMAVSEKLAPMYDVIKEDSLGAIIPELGVSSKVAYSGVRLLAPPFSYQYYFGIGRQCAKYERFLERAFDFASTQSELDPGTVEVLRRTKRTIEEYQSGYPRSYKDAVLPYCKEFKSEDQHFYVVDVK